jgi:hypothetical protein
MGTSPGVGPTSALLAFSSVPVPAPSICHQFPSRLLLRWNSTSLLSGKGWVSMAIGQQLKARQGGSPRSCRVALRRLKMLYVGNDDVDF